MFWYWKECNFKYSILKIKNKLKLNKSINNLRQIKMNNSNNKY